MDAENNRKQECEQKLKELIDLKNELESLVNNPEKYIDEYFEKLKQDVQNHRDVLIDQVNAHFDEEIEDIRDQEEQSKMGG